MRARIAQLQNRLGPMGMGAALLLVLAGFFWLLVLQPLEAKQDRLAGALARSSGRAPAQSSNLGEKVAGLYQFLGDKAQPTTDSLAKLYAAGKATGVEMQSASYRAQKPSGRIERYEIVLPVSGTYSQVRDFLGRALAEVPALSLDQVTLKRESRNQPEVHAELRLTLHQVKK
jgi:hypothetical protein